MTDINLNKIQNLLMPWDSTSHFFDIAENVAHTLGWFPSDIIENKKKDSIATGHLFVEHGLENPAVISFIDNRYFDKIGELKNQTDILGLSYNNLIDFHITISNQSITAFHNRLALQNNIIYTQRLDTFKETLRSNYFSDYISKQSFRTNIPALDDELMETISKWKRYIYSELGGRITNEEISNFFNAIIFTRAYEDSKEDDKISQVMLKNLWSDKTTFEDILTMSFDSLNIGSFPEQAINKELFTNINRLEKSTLNSIFNDFYQSRRTPYKYDFSIISKHALSRIYEKYVSVLSVDSTETYQYNLFDYAPNPHEEINKSSGSYYTPQFIARFFSRFIDKVKPEYKEGNLNVLEPAVGSGIFLRTLLEGIDTNSIKNAYKNITGIDKNITACDASRLSLVLLYLVKTNSLPDEKINILTEDSIKLFSKQNKDLYDIIISNPPFINYGLLSQEDRNNLKKFLSEYAYNKSDLYLAFIKIGIDFLKAGGLGLFVLPSTFLVTDSAKLIRKYLASKCEILCLVDLSCVDYKIFEDAGIYPILLIFQKRTNNRNQNQDKKAIIATIKDYVGHALTKILLSEFSTNQSFNIFQIPQSFFTQEKWHLLTPAESNLEVKLSNYPKLESYFDIRTGFASGSIEAFIISKKKIPQKEQDIYIPYLSDREMKKYSTVEGVEEVLFYPYKNGIKINEQNLRDEYPLTYKRLESYYNKLADRSEVKKGKIQWWEPNRPRRPEFMLVPKIVTPHLVFSPKFSFDIKGEFAVSRSPFLVLKKDLEISDINEDFMFFVLGVLNSSLCTWYLLNHSAQYQNGFMMIEPNSLKAIPIVDPLTISRTLFLKYINLVKQRYLSTEINKSFNETVEIEQEIDRLTLSFYNLSKEETDIILGNYGDFD
ncbi:MAG: N-6 DNA methylase [Dysgonamonadaceae bacterium]